VAKVEAGATASTASGCFPSSTHENPGALPSPGCLHPASLVNWEADAPGGPFSSGQYIDVTVTPNHILERGDQVVIMECSASAAVAPQSMRNCDRRTIQQDSVEVGRHGTVHYQGYPVFALPDSLALNEDSTHHPECDLTHPCVLLVGQRRDTLEHPHVWSVAFVIHPTVGDTGGDPGNGLPEVPSVLALPAVAAAVFGVTWSVRRRKSVRRTG